MKTFVRLNKNEMKMVMGGVDESIEDVEGGGCTVPGTKCTSASDCGGNCPKCVSIPNQTYKICATS
jgi:hypothetical protein